MNRYMQLFQYFSSDILGFFSFVAGRIPLWVLLYLSVTQKISVSMFWIAILIIIFSRIYFDTEIFNRNPLLAGFSVLFYSFYRIVLYIGLFIIIFAGVFLYIFGGNIAFVLVPALLVGVIIAGFDIFFRKDFLNLLWGIKNLPAKGSGILSEGVIVLTWIVIITTPVYISVMGFFIIYIIELDNFYFEIESII